MNKSKSNSQQHLISGLRKRLAEAQAEALRLSIKLKEAEDRIKYLKEKDWLPVWNRP